MDATVGLIIITVITGVFSVITLKIQKNQDKLIAKIDEQTVFIEQEKAVRQKLVQAEKRRDTVIEQVTLLSMQTNVHMINCLDNLDPHVRNTMKAKADELELSYQKASEEIRDISTQYQLLIAVSKEFQDNFETISKRAKGNKSS